VISMGVNQGYLMSPKPATVKSAEITIELSNGTQETYFLEGGEYCEGRVIMEDESLARQVNFEFRNVVSLRKA
jgi:hypothetical protein